MQDNTWLYQGCVESPKGGDKGGTYNVYGKVQNHKHQMKILYKAITHNTKSMWTWAHTRYGLLSAWCLMLA